MDSWSFGNGENSEQTEEDEVIPSLPQKENASNRFELQAMEQHFLELQEEEERRDSS